MISSRAKPEDVEGETISELISSSQKGISDADMRLR
jgi:hypothetical protein